MWKKEMKILYRPLLEKLGAINHVEKDGDDYNRVLLTQPPRIL